MLKLFLFFCVMALAVYAHKKLSRRTFWIVAASVTTITLISLKIYVQSYEKSFMLSAVPDALHAQSVSYSKEESWGFGPGGNEAGIRTYPLSDSVVRDIAQRGMEFFRNMPPNKDQQERRWRGYYGNWAETPVASGERWQPRQGSGTLHIYDYICRYGFCIDIDPDIVSMANSIVNSAGSYYAYGRIGLIVVSPEHKLVVYMYNG